MPNSKFNHAAATNKATTRPVFQLYRIKMINVYHYLLCKAKSCSKEFSTKLWVNVTLHRPKNEAGLNVILVWALWCSCFLFLLAPAVLFIILSGFRRILLSSGVFLFLLAPLACSHCFLGVFDTVVHQFDNIATGHAASCIGIGC